MSLLLPLSTFLTEEAGVRPGDGVVVAFSGGADSTALLHGLVQLAPRLDLELLAAHLDHGLDPGSAARAALARAAAERLGVPCRVEARRVPVGDSGGAGLEAEARRVRYEFLDDVRREHGFRFVATAHHRDDQAETVLLRLQFGSGPLGLGGIERRRGAVLRPLLDHGRAELRRELVEAGLEWIEDPTNDDEARPRTRIRRRLARTAPDEADGPALAVRLASLAARARRARDVVDRALARAVTARREFDGASAQLSQVRQLSSELLSSALAMLHRQAGLAYPPSGRAASEIERQMRRGGLPACDCGRGYRWQARGARLHLARKAEPEPAPILFTYTLVLPGELRIEELSLRFRLFPRAAASRDFEASPRRVALALPFEPGSRVTVRTRRPGDRIRPLGWDRTCRVKDLLINRKVPRRERHRLPLLASGEDVLWIPGVAIDERCRVTPGGRAWIAEIGDLDDPAISNAESPIEALRIAP
jgi:tRNA(Ile)-lysidine synthase